MKILFLCVANSARSQMAEALGNHHWGAKHQFYSAGSSPSQPHPSALKAMKDQGVETQNLKSKHFDDIELKDMDYIITLCKEEYCPVVPGVKMHWPFADPSDSASGVDEAFLNTSYKIKTRIEDFLKDSKLI